MNYRYFESTFNEFCANIGLDNDSLESLHTYKVTQKQNSKFFRFMGRKLITEALALPEE